jgi:hypothetical protein
MSRDKKIITLTDFLFLNKQSQFFCFAGKPFDNTGVEGRTDIIAI